MTIERLSFPKGIPVQSDTEVMLRATEHIKDFRQVTENEVIEPAYLKRYKYRREIRLSMSGDSALISPNASEAAAKFDAKNVKPNKDGSFRLGEENEMFAVVGPGPRGEVRLYEFVRYKVPPRPIVRTRRSS